MAPLCYRPHRFPPEIIQHGIWLYLRFTLNYRYVEFAPDCLLQRRVCKPSVPQRRSPSLLLWLRMSQPTDLPLRELARLQSLTRAGRNPREKGYGSATLELPNRLANAVATASSVKATDTITFSPFRSQSAITDGGYLALSIADHSGGIGKRGSNGPSADAESSKSQPPRVQCAAESALRASAFTTDSQKRRMRAMRRPWILIRSGVRMRVS